MSGTPQLWHFTCDHGYAGIGKRGLLRLPPVANPISLLRVIWLTSEACPNRQTTGLTSTILPCDRMAHRYRVLDPSACVPWLASPERWRVPRQALRDLERYGDSEHWWVASQPVLVAYDEEWQAIRTQLARAGA